MKFQSVCLKDKIRIWQRKDHSGKKQTKTKPTKPPEKIHMKTRDIKADTTKILLVTGYENLPKRWKTLKFSGKN